MCGRFSLETDIFALLQRFRLEQTALELPDRKEIFPSNDSLVLQADGKFHFIKWGFLPSFSKKPIINARSETVMEKPLFRESFLSARCLVPATSFYEWQPVDEKKIKYKISVKDLEVFAMAGLLRRFPFQGKSVVTFTILTSQANDQLAVIHNRMPVILNPQAEMGYLDPKTDIQTVLSLLKPTEMELLLQPV